MLHPWIFFLVLLVAVTQLLKNRGRLCTLMISLFPWVACMNHLSTAHALMLILDDIPIPMGCLHESFVCSTCPDAHFFMVRCIHFRVEHHVPEIAFLSFQS
jgi:hypothetical protein